MWRFFRNWARLKTLASADRVVPRASCGEIIKTSSFADSVGARVLRDHVMIARPVGPHLSVGERLRRDVDAAASDRPGQQFSLNMAPVRKTGALVLGRALHVTRRRATGWSSRAIRLPDRSHASKRQHALGPNRNQKKAVLVILPGAQILDVRLKHIEAK
jgi:hypothetical protein